MEMEKQVIIDGIYLTNGQAMALRVAVTRMLSELADPAEAAELGLIADIYRARLREVERILVSV